MKRSIVLATPHLQPIREISRVAEAKGFFRVWTTEYTDRDALVRCAIIGEVTSSLQIGTGIAYSFSRHPVTIAAAAADIHEATDGRFSLGLGTGTRGMRKRWFGILDEKPVAKMREGIALLRSLWESTGSVSFHGDYFDCEIDAVDHWSRLQHFPRIKVLGSGLRDQMLDQASTWCDGLLLHPLAVNLAARSDALTSLAKNLGTELPADFTMSQWVITSVDIDSLRARENARRALAFYLSTPSYSRHFANTAWKDVPSRVQDSFRRHGPAWEVLSREVPEPMLEEYCIAGTPEQARERAVVLEHDLKDVGVSELVFQVAVTSLSLGETTDVFKTALQSLRPT